MEKDFDGWLIAKKHINTSFSSKNVKKRECWVCIMGTNIGAEIDGKDEAFSRPVLVIRAYGRETALIVPFTSRPKHDMFHFECSVKGRLSWIALTQMRIVSTKRLVRKLGSIEEPEFLKARDQLAGLL